MKPQPNGAAQRKIYVFWDLKSMHPGVFDPRVICGQLRQVLSHYGHLEGIYVYGVKRFFNWVPEAFIRQYPFRRQAHIRRHGSRQVATMPGQQAQLPHQHGGRLRCPACGAWSRSYQLLQKHYNEKHKSAAPPEAEILARMAASNKDSGTSKSTQPGQEQGLAKQQLSAGGQTSRGWDGSMESSGLRTLGRVGAYYNSTGQMFKPAAGQQISLKYVLLREPGLQLRVVANLKRDTDKSMSEAIQQLLEEQQLQDAETAQHVDTVICVVSNTGSHGPLLEACRRNGCRTVAISQTYKDYPGCDVTLRWWLLMNGRYR